MTITGALDWFFFAMLVYPEAQRLAQEELDRVIGRQRAPTFDDFDQLPYIQAMVGTRSCGCFLS